MRIGPRTGPSHCEGSICDWLRSEFIAKRRKVQLTIRHLQCFGYVNAAHSAWTLNYDIAVLTSLPRRHEQLIEPASELNKDKVKLETEACYTANTPWPSLL